MNDSFLLQAGLWGTATTLSALATTQYFNFKRKERNLPAACELANLEAELALRREEWRAANEAIGRAQITLTHAEETRKWMSSQQAELVRIQADRKAQEELRAEVIAQSEKLKALMAELARAGKDVAAEEAKVVSLATQKAELTASVDDLTQRFKQLQQDITDRTLHLNGVQNDINLRTIDLDRLKATQEATEKIAAKAKEALDQKLNELDAAKRALADTENQKASLEQEVIRLKAELQSLETWRNTLTALLQKIEADLKRVHPPASGEDRYRDLWEPLPFAPLPTRTISKDKAKGAEDKALQATAAYLESHGLQYPKRVLHAFHAALKTADMSPLVVLAGISGTGKSLLPKRYSESMGIHMVSLAVQPRWDSPQDLFGFFNHLEGRYKATELARAMVQFERYNRPSWNLPKDWNHSRDDRMLLVLLDEMNLARVEYYFSEFLSKLETRRSILNTESDARSRDPVEIALDTGSLREGEHNIRLYPGRNLLFTGTMNEDESTQSLSDKVLDRACVLRFGRPAKMASVQAPTPLAAEKDGLAYDTWRAWCEYDLSSTDEKKVNAWIGELNDAMEQIGKPFAHRVHQAILSYAGNYPREANRVQLAMADQIEQRIMPKLRGLELEGNQEALDAIKKVIKQADDAALMKAFEAAAEHHSGTFLWRGLDRTKG
jgi:predicted  nucleic acid-binding Zn-ribbon protein